MIGAKTRLELERVEGEELEKESVINYFKEFAAKEIRQAVGGTGVNRKKFKTTEIKTCLYVDENYIIKKMMMVGESWGEMESAWKQK